MYFSINYLEYHEIFISFGKYKSLNLAIKLNYYWIRLKQTNKVL